jgi:hypothetical protein
MLVRLPLTHSLQFCSRMGPEWVPRCVSRPIGNHIASGHPERTTHGNPGLPNAGSKLNRRGVPSAPAELPIGVEAAVAVRRGAGELAGEVPPRYAREDTAAG